MPHRPFVVLGIAGAIGGLVMLAAEHSGLIVSTAAPHQSAMVKPPAGIAVAMVPRPWPGRRRPPGAPCRRSSTTSDRGQHAPGMPIRERRTTRVRLPSHQSRPGAGLLLA